MQTSVLRQYYVPGVITIAAGHIAVYLKIVKLTYPWLAGQRLPA